MRKIFIFIVLNIFTLFILFPQNNYLYAQQRTKTTIAILNIESRGGVSENEAPAAQVIRDFGRFYVGAVSLNEEGPSPGSDPKLFSPSLVV